MIPLILDDGTEIKLSPGSHSKLIRDIVKQFGPRFAPGSEVIYLGDTGAKKDFFRQEKLASLGVIVNTHILHQYRKTQKQKKENQFLSSYR